MRPSRGSGTGGGGYETWRESTAAAGADSMYPTSISTSAIWSAAASLGPVNRFMALPFLPGVGGSVDRISYYLTTASGGGNRLCRVGIYDSKGAGSIYPNALIVDAGTITTAGVAGLKSSGTFAVSLRPNKLYWLCYMLDHTVSDPSVLAYGGSTASPSTSCGYTPLGYGPGTSVNPQQYIYVTPYAYAACPATYPAGAVVGAAATVPLMYVRYA